MGKGIDRGENRLAGNAAVLAVAACVLLAGCTSFMGQQDKRALAQVLPTVGNQVRGTVSFVERSDGVQVSYNLAGLPPDSDHAIQVHDRGDCNAADASSAGAVFAPAADRLKPGARVEGDLGNIHADSNGVATGFIVAPDVSLDGVRSVLQRSVLVHHDAIDPYAYPARGTGPALACGVIKVQ
ncbi:superoxide dismutase family protein [Paraburkholderia silviterrae]|uniref:Superoxide dismutase family protein n=1 Tax=Paraburkholderia silviterrae TaxID=2528715 RepID=A0A4R5M4U0_9BURK|nr:superoxide dismutase family protein [Paraburkholderia silviterrae]TDG20771.1 superoxide dismutase family protein [Paraburkholderia silviterrae]